MDVGVIVCVDIFVDVEVFFDYVFVVFYCFGELWFYVVLFVQYVF